MKRLLLIPHRITVWLAGRNSRAYKLLLMAGVLVTALYTKEYRGEHQIIINNSVGGILYVLFGSLLFSALLPKLKLYWPVVMAFGATCMLEFIQYLHLPFMVELTQQKSMAYLFGVSFNPTDFIYYLGGAVIALFLLLMLENRPAKENKPLSGASVQHPDMAKAKREMLEFDSMFTPREITQPHDLEIHRN